MKLATILIAAVVGATGVSAVPAAAQERVVVRERTVTPAPQTNTRVVVRERSSTTRRAYAYGHRRQRVCTVRYRHGDRIRTCRWVVRRY